MVNVRNQRARVIINADRDVYLQGTPDPRRAASELRAAVTGLALDPATSAAVRADVDEIEDGLAPGAPDPQRVARATERLTGTLERAGALATAGAALVTPLRTIGGWLGSVGESVLRMLPGA
ncbi:hypothetical protein [Cellulomonas cellasea]|uniref:Uncharacterized protein n=1 Tax=Cellulomonas cellasea TaxID=43670 RepID=A0A7W4UJF8_9CELL|nr:hypothetical protein [Cellulomonas cellasea]MBB2925296.1 hypothetical protein [Cellulomonas cellasea]